ncbi:DinB family protein [Nocardioides sp. SYSU D00038]|uniref:DinB family protein n=1 Tax=Nocardioides sp. SYSU D00038 TaxID=2812554 RepID=UPI0019671DD0|nr:DinB family protein [Nocardioides sp. SYSU D00038]
MSEQQPAGPDLPLRGERAVLEDYLRHYRATFERQCSGLDADQLARRAVPPSSLSLLGLLRHLAAVEHSWWRRVVGRDLALPRLWGKDDRRDADFDGAVADPAVVEEAWAAWRTEVAHAEDVLAATPLDALGAHPEGDLEVREVVVHLVEEYARHCGHADLLRECIDGRTDL